VDYEKNFSGILRVIKKVRTLRNDFVLNIVHDSKEPEFEQFVIENELSDTVIFHGRKNEKELAAFYNNADFVLLFSHFETFSCVVMEALACGKSAIATCTGAIPEMLAENRGIVIPPNDEIALEKAINYMLDHHQNYDSAAIRNYAIEHFNENAVGEMFMKIYEKINKNK
jgi:glycosyltransferase involved in cell wall biosynthesis